MIKEEYEKELDKMSERISKEGIYAVKTFQGRLGFKLRIYKSALKEVEDMRLETDMERVLRIQLRQVFKILKWEGIRFP